ncbi:MAG: GNAT family N-acetyltransferase [Jatrophihabitans sp.]
MTGSTADTYRVAASTFQPEVTDGLLRSLPEWFGDEPSIVEYVEAAGRLPTYLATAAEGAVVGVLLLEWHFPTSAEVHLMAVDREWHRRGVGRALVAAAERDVRSAGASLLSVKTLGASRPDTNYAATRKFYGAIGFLPLEELLALWPGNPCLVLVKPLGRGGSTGP